MKTTTLIILFLLPKTLFGQDEQLTGEKEWTEEKEKAIINEVFLKENYPIPYKSDDLSYLLPPAGKQGQQGSCWAWATTYALRSAMDNPGDKNYFFDKNGELDSTKVYSPAFTYQYYKGNQDNCDYGLYASEVLDNLLKNGAISLKEVAYDENKCNIDIGRWLDSAKKNSKKGYDVGYIYDVYSAKYVLSQLKQPVIISMRLGSKFHEIRDIKYTGQNIFWKEYRTRKKPHAMVLVAYNDSLNAFKVFNSWGRDWGMDGYCYIDYSIIEQGFNYFCYPKQQNVNPSEVKLNKNPIDQDQSEGGSENKDPSQDSLSTWFKEGFYRPFESFKITLAELNPRQEYAVIQIRDINFGLINSFYIEKGASKNLYLNDQQYIFTLNNIGAAGKNFFTKGAYFTIKKSVE